MKKAAKAILEDKEEDLKAALAKIADINEISFYFLTSKKKLFLTEFLFLIFQKKFS